MKHNHHIDGIHDNMSHLLFEKTNQVQKHLWGVNYYRNAILAALVISQIYMRIQTMFNIIAGISVIFANIVVYVSTFFHLKFIIYLRTKTT